MKKIFLSYSHSDGKYFAEYLFQRLQGAGYTVWKDDHNIPLGLNFPEQLSNNVVESDYFVVLLTHDSISSDWVTDEINIAKASKRRIIPVLVHDINLPPSLIALNSLDMSVESCRWRSLNDLVTNFTEGDEIPRVYNMSGHSGIEVKNILVLDHCDFKYADLSNSASVHENAVKLGNSAIPYIVEANSGIVPHGHPALASATLAYLLGAINQMPKLYWTQKNENDKFGIDATCCISLQDMRNLGFENRNSVSKN